MSRKNHNQTFSPSAAESGQGDLDHLARECQRLAALEREAEEMARRLDEERRELLGRIGRTCDKLLTPRQCQTISGRELGDIFHKLGII